jgi:hypothetical protein
MTIFPGQANAADLGLLEISLPRVTFLIIPIHVRNSFKYAKLPQRSMDCSYGKILQIQVPELLSIHCLLPEA